MTKEQADCCAQLRVAMSDIPTEAIAHVCNRLWRHGPGGIFAAKRIQVLAAHLEAAMLDASLMIESQARIEERSEK